MRHTTKKQDAAMLARMLQDVRREWKQGDACLSFNSRETTTFVRRDGDICTLADGSTGHHTRMRRPS